MSQELPPQPSSQSSSSKKNASLDEFIRQIPKVELHVHLEGTMEPDLLWTLAQKNQVELPYNSLDEIRASRQSFTSLDDFLQLYYQGMSVLHTEQDFYDLTYAYLQRSHVHDKVRHAEVFFDPQPHMIEPRHLSFDTIISGIHQALQDGYRDFNMTTKLIMCFVRHLPVEHAMEVLELSLPHRDKIHAVGLDSTEKDNPPHNYKELFDKARSYGYKCVAHAGEEGPPSYVWGALEHLQVERIDHGVRSAEDAKLLQHLSESQMPLTVCPLSNICLCVFSEMRDHNLKHMLEQGVCVTINSDDPAYFGGYITDNFLALHELDLEHHHHIQLVKNSIQATFLEEDEKDKLHKELEDFLASWEETKVTD